MQHYILNDKALGRIENRYRFFVWTSRLSLPIAGFIYGFLADSQNTLTNTGPATGSTNSLMNAMFNLGILIVLFALAARVWYGLRLRKYTFSHIAKAFQASEALDDPRIIINPNSVLLSRVCFPRFTRFAMGRYGDNRYRISIGELAVGYFDISRFTKHESAMWADYMVFAIELKGNFPHIFVDGHSQNFLTPKYRNLWTLRWKLKSADKSQKLEGDFPKHFDVYSAPNRQIETLSILTPDVMQAMRDMGRGFDYEIVDNHLYIIAEPNVLKFQKANEITEAVKVLLNELLHQLKRPEGENSQVYLRTGLGKIAILSIVYYYIFTYGVLIFLPAILLTVGMIPGSLLRLLVESLFK